MGTVISTPPAPSLVQPWTAAVPKATRGFSRAGNVVKRNPGAEAGAGVGWAGQGPLGRHHCPAHSSHLAPSPLPPSRQPATLPVPVQFWGSLLSPPQNSEDLAALAEPQVSISGCSFSSQDWGNKPSNAPNLTCLDFKEKVSPGNSTVNHRHQVLGAL